MSTTAPTKTPLLPANRVAALATFITGLAGAGTALANVWPSATTNEVALIAGGVATLAGPLAHIVGSWLWDKRTTSVKLKELELELEKFIQSAGSGTTSAFPYGNSTNVTDVTDVTVPEEYADDNEPISDEDVEPSAVPENLNEKEWLANRDPARFTKPTPDTPATTTPSTPEA